MRISWSNLLPGHHIHQLQCCHCNRFSKFPVSFTLFTYIVGLGFSATVASKANDHFRFWIEDPTVLLVLLMLVSLGVFASWGIVFSLLYLKFDKGLVKLD